MKTHHQLITTNPIARITGYIGYIGGNPPIRSNGSLPDINEGLPDGYAYVPILPQSAYPHDSATHKLVRMDQPTLTEDGWEVVALTEEEIAARQPSLTDQLNTARSAMSGIIAGLPVESRAKFANSRAGIEKLLDLGDVEAAHYQLGQLETDTEAEHTVKVTLLTALQNFLS